MTDPYLSLRGVTVEQYRRTLLEAAADMSVVKPPELREPIKMWLRAAEEQARREGWKDLAGHRVVASWETARVILRTRERRDTW